MNFTKTFAVVSFAVGGSAIAATTTTSIESGRRIQIGVQAGMLVNQVNAPEDLKVSNRSGLTAGVVLDVPIDSAFAVRTEALYQRRSSTLAQAGNAELTTNSDSIIVPVTLRWSPIQTAVSPFLMAGPTVTFNVNNTVEGGTRDAAAALGYDPNTVEFGATAGAGLDIGPVFAAARYNWGLTELSSKNADFKSRGWQFLAGLRF